MCSNGNGTVTCGQCDCDEGRYGAECECDGESGSNLEDQSKCMRYVSMNIRNIFVMPFTELVALFIYFEVT